ncbi:hypothetical protein K8I85_18485 [bacterium]|nr:hypothetical protein [bacterium]
MHLAWPLLLLILSVVLVAPPADAQLFRVLGVTETDGEPTDPDGALAALNATSVNLEGTGLENTSFETQVEEDAWWDALLELLREWGLLEEDANR